MNKLRAQPIITSQFKTFIQSLLGRALIKPENIDLYTDQNGMIEFRKAFTHKSYDKDFNYEFLEFHGDVVVNFSVVQYLQDRFPKVISVKWLTKLKHNLGSKTVLSDLAIKGGFLGHILYGKEIENIIKKRNYQSVEFTSMMEDTFEAFIGATVSVINMKNPRGVGYAVSYAIIKSFFDEMDISLRWDDVFDATSRIKELYESHLGWGGFEQNVTTKYIRNKDQHLSLVNGYPLGDRTVNPLNKTAISRAWGSTSQKAQESASRNALYILQKRYNIREIPPSAYFEGVDSDAPVEAPCIPRGFKDFVLGLLKNAKVKDRVAETLTREDYLLEFRMSLVDKSYDKYVNYNLYKYEGISVVDLALAEYLFSRFPQISSEKWLTNIKHNIVSQGVIAKFAEDSGFSEYALYGLNIKESLEKYPKESNIEYKKMLGSMFKAFFGALVRVVDKETHRGVGYMVAYNLLGFFMNEIPISVEYTNVFDSKSRLKELYDTYRWVFDQSISVVFDRDKGYHIATIIGYPKGDKTRKPYNKVVLAVRHGRTKTEASQKALDVALEVLSKQYNIRSIPLKSHRV